MQQVTVEEDSLMIRAVIAPMLDFFAKVLFKCCRLLHGYSTFSSIIG
jgi:hypothetical protein